jgi:hypothetical protein
MRFLSLLKNPDTTDSLDRSVVCLFEVEDGVVDGVGGITGVAGVEGAVEIKLCMAGTAATEGGVEGVFDGGVEIPYTITASAFRRVTVVV